MSMNKVNYTKLKPAAYIPRFADKLVEDHLNAFGAVEIGGTMWCGKSWTASAFAESIVRVDENSTLYQDDPSLTLMGAQPHAIDEWQDVPAIWNLVRHRIDDSANEPGQFILTGSSTPPEHEKRHSGAGRIGRIRMRTMTLAETGESSEKVSLSELFEGKFESCESTLELAELANIVCRGGWPSLQGRKHPNAKEVVEEYLDSLFDISMRKAAKDPVLSRRIAVSLARNLGTSATLATIAKDASANDSSGPSEETVSSYVSVFVANYFVDELHGWDAPVRSRSRVRTKPKRYFDDPSLAAALLGIDSGRLLQEGQLFGALFESLCVHDVSVYAGMMPQAQANPLRYYADADGLEVDMVIELRDGRWAAIEVKLGESKVDEAAANLLRLRSKIAANPAARNKEPQFLAVLVGKGGYARRRKQDGVYVIPVDTLTA